MGNQNRHSVDALTGIGAILRDSILVDLLNAHTVGGQTVGENLVVGHIGEDIASHRVIDGQQISPGLILQLLEDGLNDHTLTLGTAEVVPLGIGRHMADPGISQSGLAVEMVHTLRQTGDRRIVVLLAGVGVAAEIVDFGPVELNINASHGINDINEALEVDLYIVVDMDTEVLFDRGVQQLKSAKGIGGVDLVVAVARDLNVEVTHDGEHAQSFICIINTQHDHGIRTSALAGNAGILTNDKHIDDLFLF